MYRPLFVLLSDEEMMSRESQRYAFSLRESYYAFDGHCANLSWLYMRIYKGWL